MTATINTITFSREQVGSSFKPYVLSTAVSEGMDVEDSIMNSSTYLCIPPCRRAVGYSAGDSCLGLPMTRVGSTGCPVRGITSKIENDGGEPIGSPVGPKGDNLAKTTVQNALAQSSNTAFTDLAHRASTTNVVAHGEQLRGRHRGISVALTSHEKNIEVPFVTLGEASLTVNEQAQMIATIDDNGVFHFAHVVKSWQLPDEAVQTPNVQTRARC